MIKKVLLLQRSSEGESAAEVLEARGYHVVRYSVQMEGNGMPEASVRELLRMLYQNFFYFVFSEELHEEIYQICMETATKYIAGRGKSRRVANKCLYPLENIADLPSELSHVFEEKEWELYEIIGKLTELHDKDTQENIRLENLAKLQNPREVCRLTEVYFHKMEQERQLMFLLKDGLMKYIDGLLAQRSRMGWQEIILWGKRQECRSLCNRFWEFYLLQKAAAIYAEEMIDYYKCGDEPSIIQIGSMEELAETYFHTLLLLRRLVYEVSPQENGDIWKYLMDKKLSGIFVRHIVEENQIENKEKVYQRLEELLLEYEQ